MRLLADENFPKPVVEALRAEGHDVVGPQRLRWATRLYPLVRTFVEAEYMWAGYVSVVTSGRIESCLLVGTRSEARPFLFAAAVSSACQDLPSAD